MQTLKKFIGLNNVLEPDELRKNELSVASNVDINLDGRIRRRAGYSSASATEHKNVWEAGSFTLATRGAAGDLVNVTANTVLRAGLGHTRVWYAKLPDGRVLYANGVTNGIVNAAGTSVITWGVAVPSLVGVVASSTAGNLHSGNYQWSLTHQRLADGAEGGPAYKDGYLAVTGGVSFTGIPVPAGYRTNVYLTSSAGGERFLAGYTTNGSFAFAGFNKDLQQPCRTEFMQPAPAGKLAAFWRGRALVAAGRALYASRPHSWELFDLRRDFKYFSADITLVQPVDGGVWVGTETELMFLAGSKWDDLVRQVKVTGRVVLGSGCSVPGEQLMLGDNRAEGDCMVCIADGWLMAGLADGTLKPLSVDRYRVTATEVWSAFRMIGTAPEQVPQYIAVVQ